MHVLVRNGAVESYPYTIGNLRRDNGNVSFPKRPSDETLAQFGMLPVTKVARPEYDHTKNITEGTPVLIDGEWTQVWNETDATAEEIAERTANEESNVRAQRNQLLADTDWAGLSDTTMSSAMATYRQALRDVTDQAGFPWTVNWPTKPE
jgi:hypothetical protein